MLQPKEQNLEEYRKEGAVDYHTEVQQFLLVHSLLSVWSLDGLLHDKLKHHVSQSQDT